ncbi:MAG: ISL3 family transposase, partial [Phycisphaeraceae bacterium]
MFAVSWETVYRSVQWAVAYGLAHRDLTGITAIGVDEVAWRKGHRYLTLVYQIDEGRRRLLHIREGRTLRSLMSFFVMMRRTGRKQGIDLLAGIQFVCSDMWKPYLRVIAKMLPDSLHILDRCHIHSGAW